MCVGGSTERKGFSRPTLCLSLSFSQPFSFSPILQSFPRGVERATERAIGQGKEGGDRASERASWAASDRGGGAAPNLGCSLPAMVEQRASSGNTGVGVVVVAAGSGASSAYPARSPNLIASPPPPDRPSVRVVRRPPDNLAASEKPASAANT